MSISMSDDIGEFGARMIGIEQVSSISCSYLATKSWWNSTSVKQNNTNRKIIKKNKNRTGGEIITYNASILSNSKWKNSNVSIKGLPASKLSTNAVWIFVDFREYFAYSS
jgi:hypothetical protein